MNIPLNSSNSSVGSGNTKQIPPSLNWCFTLNNYTKNDISSIVDSTVIDKYVFQEETGESGTPHLQGYIKFIKKLRPKALFNSKIHWEKTRNVEKSIAYCSKEDTRSGQIFTNIRLKKPIKIIKDLYPWQKRVVEIIEEDPSDRTIYWFWEKTGNVGKSALCKYLVVNHNALIVSGKASDVKYMIVKYHEKHKVYPELIVYDIPRSCENYISWCGIEEIKNGLFASTKYECEMVVMNSPHLICFANFKPDKEIISKDRWDITNLDGYDDIEMRIRA